MVYWRFRTLHLKRVMVAHLSQLHCGQPSVSYWNDFWWETSSQPTNRKEQVQLQWRQGWHRASYVRGSTEEQWVQIREAPPSSWCSSSPTSELGCLEQSRKPTEMVSLIYTLCIALGISYIMLEMACNSIASCRSYYMFHSDHMCAVLGNCHHST